jgi:3-oxoadipate enol-lactonase
MPQTTSGGCRLHYLVDGAETAPAVVLLHSIGTSATLWTPQVAALSGGRLRVVRCDARGHGQSGTPPGEYTLEQLGRDVLAVLDALGVERAHVCGLSLGALTAMWLAVHAPRRIATLVLSNTAARIGTRELWETRIRRVREGGMEAIADAATSRWFTDGFRRTHSDVAASFRSSLAACAPEGYMGCCATLRDSDLHDRLGAIDAPTLVVAGARDEATSPSEAEVLRAGIRGARMLTLDAAHLSNVERAQEFNDGVIAFIEQEGPVHG